MIHRYPQISTAGSLHILGQEQLAEGEARSSELLGASDDSNLLPRCLAAFAKGTRLDGMLGQLPLYQDCLFNTSRALCHVVCVGA